MSASATANTPASAWVRHAARNRRPPESRIRTGVARLPNYLLKQRLQSDCRRVPPPWSGDSADSRPEPKTGSLAEQRHENERAIPACIE